MSSLVDAIMNSDTPASDLGLRASQEREKVAKRRLERDLSRPRSSSRQMGGPQSDSQGPQSDIDGFLDDDAAAVNEALRRQRSGPRPDVPRVVDTIGETISRRFEEFLEKYSLPAAFTCT